MWLTLDDGTQKTSPVKRRACKSHAIGRIFLALGRIRPIREPRGTEISRPIKGGPLLGLVLFRALTGSVQTCPFPLAPSMEHNFFANGSSPSLVPSPSPSNVTRADLELDFRYTLCHWILAGLYLVPLALCLLWRLRPLLSGAPASFWQIIFVVNMLIGLLGPHS